MNIQLVLEFNLIPTHLPLLISWKFVNLIFINELPNAILPIVMADIEHVVYMLVKHEPCLTVSLVVKPGELVNITEDGHRASTSGSASDTIRRLECGLSQSRKVTLEEGNRIFCV